MERFKKFSVIFCLGFSFFPSIKSFACCGEDIPYLIKILIQAEKENQKLQDQYNQLTQITDDIKNWRSLDWSSYNNSLNTLLIQMENTGELSANINNGVTSFQNLFPGYSTNITGFNKSFQSRNQALINVLRAQMQVANQSHEMSRNNAKQILNTAAAISQAQLVSLRQLNEMMEAESRKEAAFRANHLQQQAEERLSVQKFIGTYKKQNQYKTWVGENK